MVVYTRMRKIHVRRSVETDENAPQIWVDLLLYVLQ
jgi:hypothetical protein